MLEGEHPWCHPGPAVVRLPVALSRGVACPSAGVSKKRLSELYKELGDPGDVAEACRHTQVGLAEPSDSNARHPVLLSRQAMLPSAGRLTLEGDQIKWQALRQT